MQLRPALLLPILLQLHAARMLGLHAKSTARLSKSSPPRCSSREVELAKCVAVVYPIGWRVSLDCRLRGRRGQSARSTEAEEAQNERKVTPPNLATKPTGRTPITPGRRPRRKGPGGGWRTRSRAGWRSWKPCRRRPASQDHPRRNCQTGPKTEFQTVSTKFQNQISGALDQIPKPTFFKKR